MCTMSCIATCLLQISGLRIQDSYVIDDIFEEEIMTNICDAYFFFRYICLLEIHHGPEISQAW